MNFAMAVKLRPLAFSKRILICVSSSSYLSSISCAKAIETHPETNQNPPNLSEFELNIQSLRNKLVPDNLVRVLDNTDDLSSAVKLFKWASLQKRFTHTAETYYKMILKLGLAGNVKEMDGVCQHMVKDRCPGVGEASLELIDVFVRHGRLSEAMRVLVNMQAGGYRVSIERCNVVLGALVKEKRDFREVVLVYKEMVKAGMLPSVETLNYLMEGLLESDRIESALDQYRRMKKKGCSPNSRTFEIIIQALFVRDRVDEAVVVVNEMFELGCQPDLSFCTCIMPLLCGENKLVEGVRLFDMMRASNLKPDSLIYEVLLQCLCKNLYLDDLIKVLEDMIKAGLTPPSNVFVDVMNVFCTLGKIDDALKFLEDKHILDTSAYNVLLEGWCNTGELLIAKDLLVEMSERNLADCNSWNILIRWLGENARIREVFGLLDRMVVSSSIPDYATYSALVVGYCKMSNYRKALEMFHHICTKYWVLDPRSYSELVKCLCIVEMTREAADVFYYMSSNRCTLQSSSFNMLIKGMCEAGEAVEAIRLQKLAYYSGTFYTSSTYSTVLLGLSRLDKTKEMLVILSKMLVEGCSLDLDAYCILIQSMSFLNRVKKCVFLFSMMVSKGLEPDSERLVSLLSCIAKHSQLHRILGSIQKLIPHTEALNSTTYNILIHGLWIEGYKRDASRFLDIMLEKGWVPDAKTHALLIGSAVSDEVDKRSSDYDTFSVQDTVSNILAEGLNAS